MVLEIDEQSTTNQGAVGRLASAVNILGNNSFYFNSLFVVGSISCSFNWYNPAVLTLERGSYTSVSGMSYLKCPGTVSWNHRRDYLNVEHK